MSLWFRTIPAALLVAAVSAAGAVPDRISGAINPNERAAVHGIKPVPPAAIDRGLLAPERTIAGVRLILDPPPGQASALEQLLETQRDPASPDFHRWLTPEEFGDRFGASENDLARIAAWLRSEGLTIDQIARARNSITFSGSAEVVGRALRTEFHAWQLNGSAHFAASVEPSVPAALAGIVTSIRGLDDFHPRPQHVVVAKPQYTATTGAHYLAPGDFVTIYDIAPLYSAGYTGALQKLAIVGQTDIALTDIRAFRAQFGLQALDPQIVLTGPDPGISPDDEIEADLDVEWSGAIAKNANVIYVNSQDVIESLEYAVDQNLAPVISMSYGMCEIEGSTSYRSLAQQANAEGITWMNASGDSGAAGCDYGTLQAQNGPSVIFPADIPEVTAVGGTEFTETGSNGWSTSNSTALASATSYLPERAWNDTPLGRGIAGSGGGVSALFPKPWWQTGPGVPADGARDVPDVALTASGAHDPYMIYSSGELIEVGGTSCASPSFAGIVTLLNQYLVAKGVQSKPGLGNINPNLYALAQSSSAAAAFHDTTAGNNIVPCTSGSTGCKSGSFGYSATVGYDPVTGLGSVDVYNFVMKWSATPAAPGTTTTLSASPATLAQSGTTQITATVAAVSGSAAPTGSISFAAGQTALGSSALAASGTKSTGTLTVKGASLTPGTDAVTATYAPSGNFSASTGSLNLVVSGPVATTMTVAASPAALSASSTAQITATVKPASGTAAPTGTINVTLGNTVLGSASLTASGTSATASVTVKASSLSTGNNSISVSYTPTGNFSSSSASVIVSVTAPAVATAATLAASPATVASTVSTQLTATVKAASGIIAPSGTVTFTHGATTLGSAAVASSTGTATASVSLTVKASALTVGANTITATYTPSGNFASSAATVVVTVTSPLTATVTTATTSASSIASTASVNLSAIVKATAGTAAPAGSVVFAIGTTTLGTATLASGSASLTVKGTSLASGANTITVTYSGNGTFAASSATVTVTVTGAIGTNAAAVSLTATKTTSQVQGFPVNLEIGETAGVAATVTGFTINGTDFSSVIAAAFGSAKLPAHGSLAATLIIQWSPLPATLTFALSGTDANGHAWSQTASLSTAPTTGNAK